jgi:hypothetical protein
MEQVVRHVIYYEEIKKEYVSSRAPEVHIQGKTDKGKH